MTPPTDQNIAEESFSGNDQLELDQDIMMANGSAQDLLSDIVSVKSSDDKILANNRTVKTRKRKTYNDIEKHRGYKRVHNYNALTGRKN